MSLVGVVTGVVWVKVDGVRSIVKVVTPLGDEALLTLSVTVIVQLLYVPSASSLKVMVLLPRVALVVRDEHEPPYEMVPASVVLNV